MPRLLRNWPSRPIAWPQSSGSIEVSIISMGYAALHSSSTWRIFVAIFRRCCSRGIDLERVIVVEGVEIELPTVTSIPLSFAVNELITNAAKHGKGRITVRLERNPGGGYALSVSNDGPVLPEGFDPFACKGLGMKIIRSLVERIGGELHVGRGDNNQGTRFTVLFS